MVTAKHKLQRLVFNPVDQKLNNFLDKLEKVAKDALGVAAEEITEQFKCANLPSCLKKSKKQAHLEIGAFEQIVSHLRRELKLNGLEASNELQIKIVR